MKNKYLINTQTTLFSTFYNQKKQGDLFIKCATSFFTKNQVSRYIPLLKLGNNPNQLLKYNYLKKIFSTILLCLSVATTTLLFGQDSADQSSAVQVAACDVPELSVNQSGCNNNTTGIFNIVKACEAGAVIEFSTNEGATWTTVMPVWEDGVGLIARCRDPISTCTSSNSNKVTATMQVCVEICNNNIDDDGDGAIDCADGECQLSMSTSVRNETFCQGSFYELNGVRYTESGTYTVKFNNASRCDSIVTLNLTMIPAKIKLINQAICQGGSFDFNGTTYTEAGKYTANLTATSGCDSIVTVTLTNNAAITNSINEIICQGQAYTLNGKEYTTAGIYTDTLTTTVGCDSIVTVNLSVQASSTSTINKSICQGSSYYFNGASFEETGAYTTTLTNSTGCDSIVNLNLFLKPPKQHTINDIICQDATYTFNENTYTEAGTYTNNFVDAEGCDSIIHLQLTTAPNYDIVINDTICQGAVYSFNGVDNMEEGTYIALLTSSTGCDSIVVLNLSLKPCVDLALSKQLALGQSDTIRPEEGINYEICIINEGITDAYNILITDHIPEGLALSASDTKWTVDEDNDATYTIPGPLKEGETACVNIKLQLSNPVRGFIRNYAEISGVTDDQGVFIDDFDSTTNDSDVEDGLEDDEDFEFIYFEPCPYVLLIPQIDTIYIGDTIAISAFGGTSEATYLWSVLEGLSCNNCQTTVVSPQETTSYTYIVTEPTECTARGVYTIIVLSESSLEVDLGEDRTICAATATALDAGDAIGTYQWTASDGTTIENIATPTIRPTATTDYCVTLTNHRENSATDCITVFVNPNNSTILEEQICSNSTYFFNGDTLATSGSYTAIVRDVYGCDSTLILNLSVADVQHKNIEQILCEGDSIFFNDQFVTKSGSYQSTLNTTNGCDSTITLTVTNAVPSHQQLEQTLCEGDSLLFNDQLITKSGSYQAAFNTTNGCDSIISLRVIHAATIHQQIEQTLCEGDSLFFNDQFITKPGSYQKTLNTTNGCDSIISLTVTNEPIIHQQIERVLCEGTSFLFNDQLITKAGSYQAISSSSTSCDSITTLTVTIIPAKNKQLEQTLCTGASILFDGQIITTAGVYQSTISNSTGCDSTTILTVTSVSCADLSLQTTLAAPQSEPIQVGEAVDFRICILNEKGATAAQTTILDLIPEGMSLHANNPGWSTLPNNSATYTLAKPILAGRNRCIDLKLQLDQVPPNVTILRNRIAIVGAIDTFGKELIDIDSSPTNPFPQEASDLEDDENIVPINIDGCEEVVQIAPSRSTICQGTSVPLSIVHPLNNANYQWSPTDGLSCSDCPTPIASPSINTTYCVTTNSNGCVGTACVDIIVAPAAAVSAGQDKTICQGESIQLQGSGGRFYRWTPHDDLSDSTLPNPIARPSSSTDYVLLITDYNGCTGMDQVRVNVVECNTPVPCPTVGTALFPEKTVCTGESVQLNALSGKKWRWQPTTGLDDPQSSTPIATPLVTTAYLVTIWDEQGCISSNGRIVRVENCEATPPPCTTVAIEASPDQEICQGAQIQLYVNGGIQQEWSPTIGLDNPASATPIASPSTTTTYTVTIWDGEGCTFTEEVIVKVKECTVTPSFCSDFTIYTTADKYICPGGSARLIVNGGVKWQWSPSTGLDNPLSDIPLASPITSTYYTVVATDKDGCTAERVVGVLINEPATACEDKTITIGSSTQLSVSDGILYDWSPTTTLDNPYSPSPVATPTVTTTYTVTVTREAGCTSTDEVTVFVNNARLSNKVLLKAKVYLQGAMLPADSLLQDQLRSKNLLPFKEPYTDLVPFEGQPPCFIHVGSGGGEQVEPSVFSITGKNAIVDWVFLELRAATNPTLVVATRSALLQRDGDIVDVDGISKVVFDLPVASYYVAIRHRNHLGAMTQFPIPLSETTTSLLDFTNPTQLLYQLDDPRITSKYPMKEVGNFRYLWGGNSNGDRRIIYQGPFLDQNKVFFDVYTHPDNVEPNANFIIYEYCLGDNNMDGALKYQGTNNDVDELQFFNVLLHEENPDYLLGKIIYEQIPRE